jgi:hypothetical protein
MRMGWGNSVQPTKVPPISTVQSSVLPTAVRGGAESLKGSHRIGDGKIFLKTSAPPS